MHSIVIPAYNEALRLPELLKKFPKYFGTQKAWEFLIVEDGSLPSEVEEIDRVLMPITMKNPQWKFRHLILPNNQGKGAALDHGFRQAQGDLVGFMDADGATDLNSVMEMFDLMEKNQELDAVLGSRVKMLGQNVQRDFLRHYVGRLFATYFNLLFDIPIYDSQCGAKVFKRSAVLPMLDLVSDKGFVWDTQLIVLLYKNNAKMREHPVDWKEVGQNKVSMLKDPFKMAFNLWKFSQRFRS